MSLEKLVDKALFPACRSSAYFNAASISPMYAEAAKAVLGWQEDVAYNGSLNFDEIAEEEVYQDLHAAAARLFHADPQDIAVGSSATELMSSLAWAVYPQSGTNIVSTNAAHPSTIYAWQRVARHAGSQVRLVAAAADGTIDPAQLLAAIDKNTAVVCLSMVEYRTGQLYDLLEIARAAHQRGALLVVDVTQAAGQVPVDVESMGIDALVCAGYKWLCGPFGAAVLYLAPRLQQKLDPGIVGWRSHRVMWEFRADRLEYAASAARFEAGTLAYGCAIGLAKAVHFLNEVGIPRILQHNRAITDLLLGELERLGGECASPGGVARSSILSIRFPGLDAPRLSQQMNAQNVVVSERGGVIRISPHLYNDENDADRLLEVTRSILKGANI